MEIHLNIPMWVAYIIVGVLAVSSVNMALEAIKMILQFRLNKLKKNIGVYRQLGEVDYYVLNVNNRIKAQIMKRGYSLMAADYNRWAKQVKNFEPRGATYYKDRADKDGYTSFQLWDFMRIFGKVSDATDLPHYATNLRIEKGGLIPIFKEKEDGSK